MPHAPTSSPDSRSRAWVAAATTVAIAIAGFALWLAWSPPGANEVVGGDEGYYGTMARNLVADPHQLAGPSLSPLGPPGDKPPLVPAVMALSIRALGVTPQALRVPGLIAAFAMVLALAFFAARFAGVWGAPLAAALMIALPWFADSARVAAAEPMLTALGALAIAVAAAGPPTRARGLGAGVLLGLAFLCKLWLVALVALPVVALLWPARGRGAAPLALAVGAALVVAALQLALVAALAPHTMSHWLGIYFSFSLAGRAAGTGFADYWRLPPGYYAALLGHALLLHLPLVALGVAAAVRRLREPAPRSLLVWAFGAGVLSCFAVKSGVYAYVVMPAWIGLATLGAVSLARGERPSWTALALAAILGAPPVAARLGDRAVPLPLWFGVWVVAFAGIALARARPRLAPFVAGALVAAVVAGGMLRESRRIPYRYHVPGYAAVRAVMESRVASSPPDRACFVAPEAPAFAYHLFRTGRYWGTPVEPWREQDRVAMAADTALRVFVVDRERTLYGGWPDSATVAWLEGSTREISNETPEPGGGRSRFRIFVREP